MTRDKGIPSTAGDRRVPFQGIPNTTYLKRSPRDFSTFSDKAVPVAADHLLIEDSAEGDSKRRIALSDLGGVLSIPHGIIGWCLPSTPVAMQANPTPLCWAFATKIFIPVAFPLRGYGFALTSLGKVSHGVIRAAVWTHDYANNCPLTRVPDTRIDIRVAGMAAGWHQFPPPTWGGTLKILSAGTAWIVGTIQCDPSRGVTEPPLAWLDGGVATNGNCYAVEVGTTPGYVKEPWDIGAAVPQAEFAPNWFIV